MTDALYKRKTPPKEFVMAFIFGKDESPEWFIESNRISIPQRLIYENGKTISFVPGNYICRNLNGNIWVEKSETFLDKFKLISVE